jgi:hypothetical protein
MNRDQRRRPERDEAPPKSPQEEMSDRSRPPSTLDPRAKSSGHGKKTADKWNQ